MCQRVRATPVPGTQVSARWYQYIQTTFFSKHFSSVFPKPILFCLTLLEGPPSPVTAFSSCKVVPVQGSIPLPRQGLKAAPCLFPPPHGCCAQLVEAERRDLDAKPCSSVPNPPPHPLKSLREQTGNGCADEISGVCCKPTRLRAPGSREALAACLALTGTGELPGIATPPWVIPTERGPAATGRVAAVLHGVNNTAPAQSTETTQQYLQLFYIWINTHMYL